MGGDDAPNIVVNGADIALNKYPNLKLIFVGNKKKILPLVRNSKNLKNCEIIHADDTVKANQKPSQALRNGKNTSMWKSIELVANKRADAVVSAGNTGAMFVGGYYSVKYYLPNQLIQRKCNRNIHQEIIQTLIQL